MSDFGTIFPPGSASRVDTPDGRVAVVFSNVSEGVPMPVAIRLGGLRGLLRFAGGTSQTPLADQAALYEFAEASFGDGRLREIGLMSGGTRVTDDGHQVVITILELPGLIRKWNPSCRTLGSAPRTTQTTSLVGEHSTFIPSDQLDGHTLVNPLLDMFWFVQVNASEATDYSGDLMPYFDAMNLVRAEGGATGLFVWNGGRVTAMEIREAILRQHPCGVVAHSGRFATDLFMWLNSDAREVSEVHRPILKQWAREGLDLSAVSLLETPADTQSWLERNGFYASP